MIMDNIEKESGKPGGGEEVEQLPRKDLFEEKESGHWPT